MLFPHFIPEDQLIVKKNVVYERTTGNLGSILCLKLVKIQLERRPTMLTEMARSAPKLRLACLATLKQVGPTNVANCNFEFYAKDDLLP